jgi:hypothetical protein
MSDKLVLVRRGGATRKMTERKYNRWFKEKGYEMLTPEEIEAHNKTVTESKKTVKKDS